MQLAQGIDFLSIIAMPAMKWFSCSNKYFCSIVEQNELEMFTSSGVVSKGAVARVPFPLGERRVEKHLVFV